MSGTCVQDPILIIGDEPPTIVITDDESDDEETTFVDGNHNDYDITDHVIFIDLTSK